MKKRIFNCIFLALFIIISSITTAYAGFADFTDEQAEKKAQEQLKEQEKEHNITEIKSSDNYLTSLQVEGYTLVPEFDKQTLEYTVNEEIKNNEINIKTTTSNEKAKVLGNGLIKIEDDKNEYRVSVEAENGSIRTYIIKLNATNDSEKDNKENNISSIVQESNIAKLEKEAIGQQENPEYKWDNVEIFIIIAIIIVIFFAIVILLRNRKSKGKH